MFVRYLTKPSSEPLIIFGSFGCGKSALSAKVEQLIHSWLPDCCFILRYTGLTEISSNVNTLIGSVTEQLYYYTYTKPYDGPHVSVDIDFIMHSDTVSYSVLPLLPSFLPQTMESYAEKFNACVADCKYQVVILIDSLDDAMGLDDLSWLPIQLNDKIKIIITSAAKSSEIDDIGKCDNSDKVLWNLKDRISKSNFVHLKPFSADKWKELLSCGGDFFSVNAQLTLPDTWKDCNDKIPLQAKLFWWFAWLGETNQSDISFASTSEYVFELLENRFGAEIIRNLVSLLIASRDGLNETDVIALLKQSNYVNESSVRKLWINICWIMSHGPILLLIKNIRFMDNQLKNIARRRYTNEMNDTHKQLCQFYEEQPNEYKMGKYSILNKQKFIELPYHAYIIDKSSFPQAIYLTDLNWIQEKLKATKCVQFILNDIYLIDANARKHHEHLNVLQEFLETFIQAINYDADQFYPLFKYYLLNRSDLPNGICKKWLTECDGLTITYLDILDCGAKIMPNDNQNNGYDLLVNLGGDGYYVASLNTLREEICVWNVPK